MPSAKVRTYESSSEPTAKSRVVTAASKTFSGFKSAKNDLRFTFVNFCLLYVPLSETSDANPRIMVFLD